jgi:uncharacterized protein (TIGR03067 family)
MRSLLFLFLFAVGSAFVVSENKPDGKWVTTRLVMDGNDLPEETFKNQQLIISDTNYTFIAESVDKGILKFTDNKIDIYGKEGVNAGKHFTAIYKIEKELLYICYNLTGDKYPEDFETKGKPMCFLAVFKKEQVK